MALAGRASVTIVEAEKHIRAAPGPGHNSGVIHSGLYYKPGSAKALNCAAGRELMYRFCEENGVPHDRCGKLVVATDATELPAIEELERRGRRERSSRHHATHRRATLRRRTSRPGRRGAPRARKPAS